MTPQEEIVQLREDIKKLNQLAVQRARRCATMLGVVAIAMLISLVYAFVQQVAAEKNAEEALRQAIFAKDSQQMAVAKEKQALLAEQDAIVNRDMAEEYRNELAKCRASAK